MHHMYPISKGDQLCPLGFHPQVRWPTRCKRCFRDYKEHGGKRGDDVVASSPSLSDSRKREINSNSDKSIGRSWTSTSNLLSVNNNNSSNDVGIPKRPSSWTSTPDLDEKDTRVELVVNLALPKRRHTTTLDISAANNTVEESITIRRPPIPPSPSKEPSEDLVILRTDSLAERARKMQLLKKQNSLERESSREKSLPKNVEKEKSPSIEQQNKKRKDKDNKARDDALKSQDLKFLIQVKDTQKTKYDDGMSETTDTTETTLIDTKCDRELLEQIESLKRELEMTKSRAERAERDKSDILLRRLASMDTVSNRTAASEALKLQQKVNELKQEVEDLRDDKKEFSLRVRELELDLLSRPSKSADDEMRKKLQAAEQLCEELMDENEDIKKEMHTMEQEIDEMQDNFREDQADEYSTTKKELEQTTKNCRILSFKLKKCERKIEQYESEKAAIQANNDLVSKVKKLEEDLRLANEFARQLQTEAETTQKTLLKNKTPSLGVIGKSTSADGKFSRASLTRGGSQEDPAQLLRDLQDSIERETDLREQLKFAEEEAETLRKKALRVEDENESLMIQLKKMATKSRSRKLSPTPPSRLTLEAQLDKDEGISDEEDPAELRVLLELNEQEASQLRRKVEELELDNEISKKQIKELQDKLKINNGKDTGSMGMTLTKPKLPTFLSKTPAGAKDLQNEKKLKELETEVSTLKTQLIEKEKTLGKFQTNDNKTKPKLALGKSKSDIIITTADGSTTSGTIDTKRQLELVEQEATVLRNKVHSLEQDMEKISIENKKLTLQVSRAAIRKDSLTNDISNNNTKNNGNNSLELSKLKDTLNKVEKQKDEFETKLKTILEVSSDKLPTRIPKKYTDTNTKMQLQKMINELENEITEMRAIVVRTGAYQLEKLEKEKQSITNEFKDVKEQLSTANSEIKLLKSKNDTSTNQLTKLTDLEQKCRKSQDDTNVLQSKIKELEDKIVKKDNLIKQIEGNKTLYENQMKLDKEKLAKIEKDFDKEKKERARWEAKVSDLDGDILTNRKNSEKIKLTLEKEIATLKLKLATNESIPTKKVQELKKQNEDLQNDVNRETKKYTDLTGKYEQLEEEHVLTKAQLTSDKENLQTDLSGFKLKFSKLDSEHTKLKKENSDISKRYTESLNRIKDLDLKNSKISSIEHERNRLKTSIEEKEHDLEKLKKENNMNMEMAHQLRKENDDLRKKFTDFEKVNKVQSSFNDQSASFQQEIKKLKTKLDNAEISGKSDVAATRLRYEQQVKNLHSELTSLQRQCEKFKRDRDTFKQLLEAAQKTIGDLKNNSGRMSRASLNSGDEDDKSKIITLEQQIGCLEDELCESRLDASKLKTELVSEKSVSEIKISEMQSRLNEYEEERLVGTGRSKIPGMKTKLELSWQKEREEQQRLLQETSTLARDLRQTLFEVERERDKERLESRRKLDQLKKANDEELEEGRRKISELQCDLLELRDAHAKLRTSNEKLRRERERYERSGESATKKRTEQDCERKISALLQTVDELVKIGPDLQINQNARSTNESSSSSTLPKMNNQGSYLQPKPMVKGGRSQSPGPNSIQIASVLSRLAEASEELRKHQRVCEEEKERDIKIKRGGPMMRRAASTENETPEMQRHPMGRISRSSIQNGSLHRKSLSLDQSMQHEQQKIWKQQDDDSMSSMQSIDSEYGGLMRDSSMDSRLSGGSTQSDIPRNGQRKKKRGLMGKLRSLTKSKPNESDQSVQGSDSDVSMSSDHRSSKGNLKGRLSDIFKRSGSTPRGESTERTLSNDSMQRPVAVTTVQFDNGGQIIQTPPPTTPRLRRAVTKPPTTSTTGITTPSALRKAK